MESPFSCTYSLQEDAELVKHAINGDKKSLELLILRHQPYIYNIAWKMVLSPMDAEDVTQEVLIKVITNLSQFRAESQFRTWLYRIVVNHVLNMKKKNLEQIVTTFDNYFDTLAQMPDEEMTAEEQQAQEKLIDEVKISCSAGMLLCLDREQRMVLVLGDIFEIDHTLGAEIFRITPDNFRKKLSRARKDLYSYMNNKCGLVNKNNPCSCPKKTKTFIKQGYVDPQSLRFNSNYQKKISEILTRDINKECRTIEDLHQEIFLDQPFKDYVDGQLIFERIINNPEIKEIYGF